MAEIVILGAGLTGLSAAYHLEKNGFFDYKLFEKNSTVGGLVRSVKHEGFTFDYTGHLIHINDPYFQQFIDEVVDINSFNVHQRKSYIYSHNTYTPYPYQMHLHGLPLNVITECINGFINRKTHIKKPQSFYQWVLKYFGSGFAKHFFIPYNTKMLSWNIKNVHPSWVGRFVPKTDLELLLAGAIQPRQAQVGYNKSFFYPAHNGIQHFTDSIAQKLTLPIYKDHEAVVIDARRKEIIFTNGHRERYTTLISTLPLPSLIESTQFPTTTSLEHTQKHLIANTVVNLNLGIKQVPLADHHWIYFPEKDFPFYRLGFYHNFAQDLAPENHSAVYAEVSYIKNRLSRYALEKKIEHARAKLLQFLNISERDVVAEKTLYLEYAYVIYNTWREKNLARLLHHLTSHHIYSTGRFGAWKYSSMQEAILDGKQAAEEAQKKCAEHKIAFFKGEEADGRHLTNAHQNLLSQ